ncbi:NAD(P)/FAD-dependent oxidoreductase [Alkalihalobacterium bogoriense]|uniref:NAD(P)/FAD-dependent oxidoreductase n=1 Tax=Alkalihalobacterium bogoriense TaxID=246272 RepID=UPI001C5848B1|nr:NAD(P)/FAD-dependent oxidoreductase [Alkalihalobacterium bogoriense]
MMEVAIMGAGLSGLSCAIILEKNGITPTIFEHRKEVGDRFINGEAILPLLDPPIDDAIQFLSEQYGIFLKPVNNIQRLTFVSENEETTVRGHLGFINTRGRHKLSFEKQLMSQLQVDIVFNSKKTYEDLLHEYSHVVLATGDASFSEDISIFQKDLTTTVKGATIEGSFDPRHVYLWLNNTFAPKGYSYLLPFSKQEASIAIAFPEYEPQQADLLWDAFIKEVSHSLQQQIQITDQFQVSNYIVGLNKYPRIGNTFFTGNCMGSIQPFMGFGQLFAFLTGIYAAEAILGQGSYEAKTKSLIRNYKDSLTLRRLLESCDNQKFNLLVKSLNTETGKEAIRAKNHQYLTTISSLLKPFFSK